MPAPKGLHAEFMDRLNYYIWLGLTLLVVTVLVWLILRIRSWFIDSDDSDEPLQEMLGQFRQLQREGELSDEEYRLISQQLSTAQGPPGTSKVISQPKPSQKPPETEHSTDPSGS